METSIEEQADAGIAVVDARLDYLAEAIPKPVNYAYDPPAGVSRRSGKYIEQSVVVRNGREELGKLSLDTNGFVLTEHGKLRSRTFTIPMRSSPFTTPKSSAC